ncbi:cytochrome C [Paramagnetospirillum kuznetsovii]|uniref:Cytochrome C n=1 Tax=Paramagnetospirillum kuznetsovii TaxID=2053833 RepID=A0A364P252_9PROT|nr:c-type cytochrome [Paramagnetospirillum kuznetsovii]RAU23429.1 cytochrome C [Paramagnetospirillum kuznetsovii]
MRVFVAAALIAAFAGVTPVWAADPPAAFTVCKSCHKVDAGANGVGPSLFGVAGAKAGTASAGFKYSPAMTGWGKVWDDAALTAYLADPKGSIPGNKMVFAGMKNPDEIAAVIAYLKTLK